MNKPFEVAAIPHSAVAQTNLVPFTQFAECSGNTTLNIIAHEDDDLLFMNPDLYHDVLFKECIRSVYLTAGDAGRGSDYWRQRETAVEAAYAYMRGVPSSWREEKMLIAGHQVRTDYLNGADHISLVFMTLPDGRPSGQGYDRTHHQSLNALRQGALVKIHTVDNTATYTKPQLVETLLKIMNLDKPAKINTQQTDDSTDATDGDHSDHHASGYFAQLARRQYNGVSIDSAFTGYPSAARPQNIKDPQDIANKQNIFFVYAQRDPEICPPITNCTGSMNYQKYMSRQYKQ